MQDFELLVANGICLKTDGRFHRDQTEQLKNVILQDVAQRSGFVVVAAAAGFDALRFGDGDLHMIDVIAIQQWLEDRIAAAEQQDVLHCFLAEVVIDAEDLILAEQFAKRKAEFSRRI